MHDDIYEIKKLHDELDTKLGKTDKYSDGKQTIRKHTDMLLKEAFHLYECEYIDKHEYKLLCYACERHDYGKLNEKMQDRMRKKYKFNPNNELMHNIYSALFIHEKDFENDSDFKSVLYAVLFHHDDKNLGYTPSSWISNTCGIKSKSYNNSKDYLETLFEEFFNNYKTRGVEKPPDDALDYIDEMLRYCDNDKNSGIIDNDTYETYKQMIKMKGLLHKCDYSASAGDRCEYKNDFLNEALERHLDSFSSANKKAEWNNLQKFTHNNSDNNIIVVAPTGSGKTEAGLLWAGNNKCFFVLPLKTAINAIYERIKNNIIQNDKTDERVAILHSDMQSYYYNELFDAPNVDEEDMLSDYLNRSKQLALPITVSTLDQIFNFTLKYYGYELKLATLSYSKIIIDEIQMYSADLLAYLIFGIEKIVEMGGKVAVLTATLPPFVKQELCKAMGNKVVFEDFSFDGKTRHNIKVIKQTLSSDDIVSFWKNYSNISSCKILVICNTIKTAQCIYNDLREKLGTNVKINLLHSRFTPNDRNKKEEDIIKVGKTENCSHEIWIATSVVEASLDIDFDFLFTELLDIFSLFQRLGRVNRKGVKNIEQANCFIYTELQNILLRYSEDTIINNDFIDYDIYELSKKAILTIEGLLSEEMKTILINTYLSEEKINNTQYKKMYDETLKDLRKIASYGNMDKDKNNIRNIHNIDIIPASVYKNHQKDIDNAENRLRTDKLSKVDRIKEVQTIRDHIVSVPYWMVASNRKKVVLHMEKKEIKLYKGMSIPVIECDYTSDIGLGEIYKRTDDGKGTII